MLFPITEGENARWRIPRGVHREAQVTLTYLPLALEDASPGTLRSRLPPLQPPLCNRRLCNRAYATAGYRCSNGRWQAASATAAREGSLRASGNLSTRKVITGDAYGATVLFNAVLRAASASFLRSTQYLSSTPFLPSRGSLNHCTPRFVGKAAHIQPVLSRDQFDVLVREPEIRGIGSSAMRCEV